jgi:hypothetical protein
MWYGAEGMGWWMIWGGPMMMLIWAKGILSRAEGTVTLDRSRINSDRYPTTD